MERLTYRDRKGRAYFDDDGSLIRGANGTFHQKKDMTGQFIHQRFVALDKAIDRLAAYEDTGLEPEEIMALIAPPNPPLTMEDLRGINGEPVWCGPYEWKVCYGVSDFRGYPCLELGGGEAISLVGYGDSWKAYRRKPEEESR